ncbi:MAG: alpha/beta hydrolase [Burkholderiales bacterium RIFCSPHIGHO2_01_FULL_63_240]|jgi:pimeloyl-ACP methyl ester carboxylesterase|nr:MAG: alpha/beta hydrolase [Burkholderiales bacterium RIFCSPHIGHO2_01_FULL_63_240]
MQLIPWSHPTSAGFTLRGWHSAPSGRPLLHFLHGNGFCGRTYEPMLRQLAEHFDLWLSDAQGHGDSDHGGKFVGWNRSADLAVEAIKAQGQAFAGVPWFAAGHSFGGVLTSLIVAEQPKLFQAAVLLDPVLFTPSMLLGASVAELTGVMRHTPLARQARGRRDHWASRDEARANLTGRGTYKGWADEAMDAFLTHALADVEDGVRLKCRPSREADIFGSMPDRLWSLLARVRTPVHVLHARRTFPFVSESVARWTGLNDHVSAQQVPGGHCFMQEHPADAARLVTAQLLPRLDSVPA